MAKKERQTGAVSLFAVIFATLLLSILVTGFVRLMIRDQQQALNNDLSQSAYDAALAGVEDAKRVVRLAAGEDTAATVAQAALDKGSCTTVQESGLLGSLPSSTDEVKIMSSSAGERFDQAYTCVKVLMDTPDYLYEAAEGKTWLIPLQTSDQFDKITIQWYTQDDSRTSDIARPSGTTARDLPPFADWDAAPTLPGTPTKPAPPMIRAQVITPGTTIDLNTLNTTGQTVFLRPVSVSSTPLATPPSSMDIPLSQRATDGLTSRDNTPVAVTCATFAVAGEYACKATLKLDDEVTVDASRNAFLRLTSLYKPTHVRITLSHSHGTDSAFSGVQPAVDSTGRANNVFRRVEARLQLGDSFAYPEGVVDLAGNICKNFSVTDTAVIAASGCDPAAIVPVP